MSTGKTTWHVHPVTGFIVILALCVVGVFVGMYLGSSKETVPPLECDKKEGPAKCQCYWDRVLRETEDENCTWDGFSYHTICDELRTAAVHCEKNMRSE